MFLVQYEFYHSTCVRIREDEMKRVGLWEDMQDGFSRRDWRENWTDYVALPVIGTVFGTIPAIVAGFCHFFTDRLAYTVPSKLMRSRAEKVVQLA